MAGDYHQEKKQQEAELISHFPPWKWTTSDWQVYRNNRNATVAAVAALSNEPVSRQQGGCSEDEKIFAFGLLPSKLAFILPSRAFYFLYWRANGDLDSTLQCRLRCRETSFRGG